MKSSARDRAYRFFARPHGPRKSKSGLRHVPRWFWLLFGLWLAWVSVLSDHSFYRIAQLKREVSRAERDTRELKKTTATLENQINDPYTRKFHAEEIARTQHGWAAPGEIVYRFRGDEAKADSAH